MFADPRPLTSMDFAARVTLGGKGSNGKTRFSRPLEGPFGPTRLPATLVAVVLLLYAVARLAMIPNHWESTNALEHDSSYLAIVARNLAAGKGFVNEAHWLVFLNPDRLPMPYHNGKPLYVVLMAIGPMLFGVEPERMGLVIAALSSSLLVLALFMTPFDGFSRVEKLFLAFLAALFPPVLQISLTMSTDALFTALFFCFVAAALSVHRKGSALLAGVLLGMAWLTRSPAILALPALLTFCCLKLSWKEGVKRFLVIASVSLAVASPWLWRTKQVFGSFLQSDDGYYLIQDIEGRRFQDRYDQSRKSLLESIERYWHSTEPPAGLMAIVKRDPEGFLTHIALNLRRVLRSALLGGFGLLNFLVLGGFAMLGCFPLRRLYSAESIAAAVYATVLVVILSIRGQSFEDRYAATLQVMFALLAGAGFLNVLRLTKSTFKSNAVYFAVALLTGGLLISVIAPRSWAAYNQVYEERHERLQLEAIAREAHKRFGSSGPVVVGAKPYYYTRVTGVSALSIPESSDAYLKSYMEKYGASVVLLTQQEQDFWRPNWNLDPPPFLRPEAPILGAYVYRRVTSHD